MDVLRRSGEQDVLVLSVGVMAQTCLEIADRLADQGMGVTVVDPRWVKPLDPSLTRLAAEHRLVVTVEDGGRAGGFGSTVAAALRDAGVSTPVRDFAIPQEFLHQAKRAELLAEIGLSAQEISRAVVEQMAGLESSPAITAAADDAEKA
jgi:1-deoxy-D-xylulose-5-phosphate synthase